MNRLRILIRRIGYIIVVSMFRVLPLRNNIVFECESDMDDNPRAFYEYMIDNHYNDNHKLIWLVKNTELCKKIYGQKNIVFINTSNTQCFNLVLLTYYLSTSKLFIFSHPFWFKKYRKSQVILNIDHGLPMKKPRSEKEYELAKTFDYIICPSEYMDDLFLKRYRCAKKQLLHFGYPRCDYLFDSNKKIFSKLFDFDISSTIIMCMPTFKQSANVIDSEYIDPYCLGFIHNEDELAELNNLLIENNVHIIVKPHPLQSLSAINMNDCNNIHYICNDVLLEKNVLLYQLLGASDALLSDLSSVCYDYLMTGKPIAYFMDNIENYTRGCIWDDVNEFIHGYRIFSFDDFKLFLDHLTLGKDDYSKSREEFAKKVWNGNMKDSSKKIADWIFENDFV